MSDSDRSDNMFICVTRSILLYWYAISTSINDPLPRLTSCALTRQIDPPPSKNLTGTLYMVILNNSVAIARRMQWYRILSNYSATLI